MTLECKRFESNGELLDNGEMFLYRQGNILSALGLIPLNLPMDMPPLIININWWDKCNSTTDSKVGNKICQLIDWVRHPLQC